MLELPFTLSTIALVLGKTQCFGTLYVSEGIRLSEEYIHVHSLYDALFGDNRLPGKHRHS